MEKERVITALDNLEKKHHKKEGYDFIEILNELKIEVNNTNGKTLRTCLRSLISRYLYPEFSTAGIQDIIYCPEGKGSGRYRLSKYRQK